MKIVLLSILIWLSVQLDVYAEENEITVLALTTGGANLTDVEQQLDYLENHWPNSGGVTIKLANNGVPVTLTSTVYTSSATQQLSTATALPFWSTYRQNYAADIMLLFTGSVSNPDTCGQAVQHNWTKISDPSPGVWNPDSSGLDLNGSENSYYALVATGGASLCETNHTAAHELAHLLGGGHTREIETIGAYLFDYSHAFAAVVNIFGTTWGVKSILAEGSPLVCSSYGVQCQVNNTYSSSGLSNNQSTFSTTAESVANYRTGGDSGGSGGGGGGGGGGSGCSLELPIYVTGYTVDVCAPLPWTQHSVSWSDLCPSATSKYEVWYSQPDGSGYVKGWDVTTTSTPVYVTGAHSRIKIKACNASNQCTSLSSSSYLATDQC